MTRRQRVLPAELPLHEELEALVRYHHHLENEHARAHEGGAVRRELEGKEAEVRERFERLLGEWVPDPELRDAWRAHLQHRAPVPSGPGTIQPLVFRGESEVSGSVVEVRGRADDLQVRVDSALVERAVGRGDFAAERPVIRFALDGMEFRETFGASPEALDALADVLEAGGPPPWEHASELLADGLIDVHVELTPRGRRALASRVGARARRRSAST